MPDDVIDEVLTAAVEWKHGTEQPTEKERRLWIAVRNYLLSTREIYSPTIASDRNEFGLPLRWRKHFKLIG
jgi:hypothetical protein